MQDTHVSAPASLEEALKLLAWQQQEIQRLHTAHEAWMRAVSHDLRAPLRHVVSFAPLLKESVEELANAAPAAVDAAGDAREFAATMEHAARRMSAMLDGMGQVSRAARMALQLDAVDAGVVVQTAVQAQLARYPWIHWEAPDRGAWVSADAGMLQTAIQVLLDNAVKFSSHQPKPFVQVHLTRQEASMWCLEVQDNGVGFEDSRAQRLGELFQRMHRDTEFEGVGCGLALLDTIAQRHGAHWRLQSQPQQGCVAVLEWPAAPAP